MLSNHLVLCQPLLLLLSIFPSIRIIQLNYKFQFDFLFIFLIKHLPYHAHLEKETATHSSTLAWKIPWTEEPGRLQSVGSWRAGHDWATSVSVSLSLSCIGEGNSNPLQCCCLKNPRDEGAWWAAIYGIAQSWTRQVTQQQQQQAKINDCWFHIWHMLSSENTPKHIICFAKQKIKF